MKETYQSILDMMMWQLRRADSYQKIYLEHITSIRQIREYISSWSRHFQYDCHGQQSQLFKRKESESRIFSTIQYNSFSMSNSNPQTGQGLSRRKKHEQQQQIVPINAQHTTTNFNLLAQQQQIASMNVHGGLHAQQQQSSLMYSHHSNIDFHA